MSAEAPELQEAEVKSPLEREALYALTEFLWQALKETASLLMKAITFFLAITAAILGYVLSHPIAPSLRIMAFWSVAIITALFTIAVGSVSWGLWTGVRDLQHAQETLSRQAFGQLGLHRTFARARVCFWIIVITSFLIVVILLGAICFSLPE